MTDVIASLDVLGDRYEIGELIGRGGMAEVHRGRDRRLDRLVAIKLLKPELGDDDDFRVRFRQEAQSAARMSHPTVVRVFDAGEQVTNDAHGRAHSVPYIVMEYVDGRMVKDIIAESPLTESEAVRITKGILTALEYSHRAGIVHRDMKPGNVMVTPGGQVKVMDFGIARAVSETSTSVAQTGMILGTAQYFSPEQARGEVVDARTDLYSTGVMLFEMLTGRPPFRGDTAVAVAYQHVSEQPVAPSTLREGISPAMDSVVLKALTKRKDERFQSADEFKEALEAALAGEAVAVDRDEAAIFTTGVQGGPATTMFQVLEVDDYRPAPQARPPVAWLWGGIALIGVLVVAIVFWAASQGPNLPIGTLSATVPSVTGMTQDEATAALEEAGLSVSVRTVVDDESDRGEALRTDPPADTRVAPNSSVTLFVSNGPPPFALTDVQGNTVAQATTTLESQGLVVAESRVTQDHPSLPEGTVLGTQPAASTQVSQGDTITLVVSSGQVTIPDVVGQPIQEAVAAMQAPEVGYQVRQLYVTSCMGGRVVQQDLTPGSHPQGGTITLTYCNGQPQPTTPPTPTTDPGNGNGDGNGGPGGGGDEG
ncbi:Stk1 family PASTA domain-containing Ser/Thr kinase [Agrococcus sp. SGAir0287]|uniref:Stk1 family PASTA domain-containing Ser/Thr kinase n=1 Tax=Agrococcus sp. SGAir0287 TaxID=2070347 RepID=UPI0010CCFFBB|nr:Stk1 family PASTA domain-containing Ser/Thr kinase [Agrococcus sp. SGAir0287]QCR18048.1 Stk1 family PASTA domain-containing Ser/Thr kinase [Agrococcus sp. SGAir0287]